MTSYDDWRRQAADHVAQGRPDLASALYAEHVAAGRGAAALAGARSVWLGEWAELGRSYPPARTALGELRRAAADRLLAAASGVTAGAASGAEAAGLLDDFGEVAAIGVRLGEPELTAEVFARLDQAAPDLAARCAPEARRHLIRAGRFELARRYLTDPLTSVDRIADVLEQRLARGFSHVPEARREAQRDRAIADYVTAVRELLTVLIGAGDRSTADEVRRHAVEAVRWPHVRDDVETALAF